VERSSTAAIRYAEAIFQVARDHNSYDLWLRELGEVAQLLADRFAQQVLLSPVVPRDRKVAILAQALPDLSPPVQRFLDLLVRRERLGLVSQVVQSLRQRIDEARGLETAQVKSAIPLTPDERQLVVARLSAFTGKRIEIQETIDPALIGGVVAQVGDEIIDGSVRGRLAALRRAIVAT
jgi:F-type H+-transporting ATPase subunit delta